MNATQTQQSLTQMELKASERTSKIYDVLFYSFQQDNFNIEDIKENFKGLSHFNDKSVVNYLTDFFTILNSEFDHKSIDTLIMCLADAYEELGLINDTTWLKDFHINHSQYSQTYAYALVQ